MDPTPTSEQQRELEELSVQLRALAQHLVRDPSAADDLVQEAWLAALNQPRSVLAEMGGWLRVVVRNLAARRARRETLRRDAESWSAATESTRATEELLERANVALALREAVLELPAPVRGVIELHYFEGLTIDATAERLGRPVETVRSQRARGLEALRRNLDRRHKGARRDWLAALLPLLELPRTRASRLRLAAALGLVAAAVFVIVQWRTAPTEEGAAAAQAFVAPNELLSASSPTAGESHARRAAPALAEVASVASIAAELSSSDDLVTHRFSCTVVDEFGRAVEAARVCVRGAGCGELGPFVTDELGRAEFAVSADHLSREEVFGDRGGLVLNAYAEGRAKSLCARIPPAAGVQEFELRLRGPGQSLVGIVVDAYGEPVGGATVEIDSDSVHTHRLPSGVLLLDDSRWIESDASGAFELHDLPVRPHRWTARAPGWGTVSGVAQGDGRVLSIEIALPRGRALAGRVRLSSGAPAAGADVWLAPGLGSTRGSPAARTDADGRYVLAGISEGVVRVFARAGERGEEFADALVEFPDGQTRAERDFDLGPRAPLRLRFLDADGTPSTRGMATLTTDARDPAPSRQTVFTDEGGWAEFRDWAACEQVLHFTPSWAAGIVLKRTLDPRETGECEFQLDAVADAVAAPVRATLLYPWKTPIEARIVAFETGARRLASMRVHPDTGVLDGLRLPAGEHAFFAVDRHGSQPLGVARLDGVAAYDLGMHVFGATRRVDLVWPPATREPLAWSVNVVLDAAPGAVELLLKLPTGQSHLELRDGRYVIFGRTLRGQERVRVPFEVGPASPPVLVLE